MEEQTDKVSYSTDIQYLLKVDEIKKISKYTSFCTSLINRPTDEMLIYLGIVTQKSAVYLEWMQMK